MKKQIKLKQLLLMAVLGFALLFIGSCKKELLTGNGPNSFEPIPSTKLTAVKQWYSRNEGLLTSEFNWLNSLSPKWDSVRVQNNEKGSIYEAVLNNPDKIFATDGAINPKDSRKKYAPKSSIRLLIFRDQLGLSYKSCFMEVIATGESELPQQLSYKNYGNLNGLVSFYELDGRLANSWVYSNGKAVMSTSSNGALKVGSSARSKSGANGHIMFEDGPPEGYIDCGNRLVAHTREVCGEVGGLEGPGYDGGEGSGKICREEMYFVSERIYCPIPSGGSGEGEYETPNPTTPGAGGDSRTNLQKKEDTLDNELNNDPNLLLDCNIAKLFKNLASYVPPQSVYNRIDDLNSNSNRPSLFSNPYYVQQIKNASGFQVNLDRFEINIDELPVLNGQRLTADQFLKHIRNNLNNFIDTNIAKFEAYNDPTDLINDATRWGSNSPLGSILHLDMADNGSLIVSDYAWNYWTVSTLRTPADGAHPVSGNRSWGYDFRAAGGYTFYVTGADRITRGSASLVQLLTNIPFSIADQLWQSYQAKVSTFVNSHSGSSSVGIQIKERPNYNMLKDYFDGKISLEQLKALKGCN